ncbi:MAG: hypothetical protein E6R10_02850 [Rhodocyclaceae bacterium]|nr:MAG: hypothetical protein E6R10_02850 [Rhodocyclaceae bacterium]
MTKVQWALVASPSIALLALMPLDLVQQKWGIVYVALAFLQGAFIFAAINRFRGAASNRGCEKLSMPMWQKIVLSAIAIYGIVLVFIGALTKQ